LTLPPVPSPGVFSLRYDWASMNRRRLELAVRFLADNDELLDLLHENLRRVEFNLYNLELYLSIAQLYRQNIQMLLDLERINTAMKTAQIAAGKGEYEPALTALDQALETAENIRQQRNRAFEDATATWYKSWYPRVAEANGRRFVDSVDDVKDHLPVRTVDMTYLIYRQLLYPLGDWAGEVLRVRNEYAHAHNLPVQSRSLDWKDVRETDTK
jgi:hypothetical protein